MQPRGPQPIGDILTQLMARRGIARVRASESWETAWRQAAGEFAAGHTRVGTVRRGVFEVVSANSTLVQELTFRKAELINQLTRLLPDEKITGLRFKVGAIH